MTAQLTEQFTGLIFIALFNKMSAVQLCYVTLSQNLLPDVLWKPYSWWLQQNAALNFNSVYTAVFHRLVDLKRATCRIVFLHNSLRNE